MNITSNQTLKNIDTTDDFLKADQINTTNTEFS